MYTHIHIYTHICNICFSFTTKDFWVISIFTMGGNHFPSGKIGTWLPFSQLWVVVESRLMQVWAPKTCWISGFIPSCTHFTAGVQ